MKKLIQLFTPNRVPIRRLLNGDKITLVTRNAYNGMKGVVEDAQNHVNDFNIQTETSVLICASIGYHGPTKPRYYILHSDGLIYRTCRKGSQDIMPIFDL